MPIDNDGSAILPTFAFISDRSLGFYRSAASSIAQSYGTLSVSTLQVNHGLTISGNVGISTPLAAAAISIDKSVTAAGGTSHGILLNPTLVAAANNDIFAFLRIQPVVTPGAFTGTQGRLIWIRNPTGAPANLYGIFIDTLSASAGANYAFYTNTGRIRMGDAIEAQDGTALAPQYAFESNRSLGWYSSGVQTIAQSLGTLELSGGGVTLSVGSLRIKSGANNSCGTAVLGSNGSVNVANTYVKTGDLIFLTDQTPGGTLGDLEILGIRNSSGFTIASTSITDTSTVAWLIVRPG